MSDQGESSRSATESPPGAGTYDPSTGVASANVDYAKSFHLRFAGNSTVRKERPKVRRRRREDEGEETDTDEEDVEVDVDLQGAAEDISKFANARDIQEARMKLSEREYIYIYNCRGIHYINTLSSHFIFP